jgi:hypothetical protein
MRLFAFAALLALPLLGLGAQSASADYYCCGKGRYGSEHTVRWAYVVKDSVIFDCDSYHCQTKIKVRGGTQVKVYCRNGWCHIKNYSFKHMWVLEHCLNLIYKEGHEGREDGGDEGAQVDEGAQNGEGAQGGEGEGVEGGEGEGSEG